MKNLFRFIGLIVLGMSIGAANLTAQILSGLVLDEHGDPAIGASVYLDGTSIGCSADANGRYSLTVKEPVNTNLVVSMVGYQTVVVANPFQHPVQRIVLQPTTVEIKAVVITGDHFTRKQKLRMFRAQVLGRTRAGRRCRILNEQAITFSYDKEKRMLEASADQPLVILNPFLGYRITFDMVAFQVKLMDNSLNTASVIESLFLGTMFFQDVKGKKGKEEVRRTKCFEGSSFDFFRALRNNSLREHRFQLFSGGSLIAPDSCFSVSDSIGFKKVMVYEKKRPTFLVDGSTMKAPFSRRIEILYKNRNQSFVVFRTKTFYLDSYGNNSDTNLILFGGDMGEKRLGDMLPLDYVEQSKAPVKH